MSNCYLGMLIGNSERDAAGKNIELADA